MDGYLPARTEFGCATLLLASPYTLFRLGFAAALGGRRPDWVLTEADTYGTLLEQTRAHLPDLLILDTGLPGLSGLDGLRQLKLAAPQLKCLVIADTDGPADVLDWLQAGARGYITRHADARQLLAAITAILSGGSYAPASIAEQRPPFTPSQRPGIRPALTPRQQQVLQLLLEGHSCKAMARELAIAPGTLKVHLAGLYRMMGARTRSEVMVQALESAAGKSDGLCARWEGTRQERPAAPPTRAA